MRKEKYSNNLNKFKLPDATNKKEVVLRSEMDKRRAKIKQMEDLVIQLTINLTDNDNSPKGILIKDYLKFIRCQLKKFNEEDKDSFERDSIIKDKINELKLKLNVINNNFKTKGNPSLTIYQPSYKMGSFIQRCINIYSKDIDFFQVWLNPAQVFNTLRDSNPSLLSFSLLAMLTRFSSPFPHLRYQSELYQLNLKNAKRCLPSAYENPSIENVTALVFLTFTTFSHLNLKLAFRYFASAVRMAQSLGLHKIDGEVKDSVFSGVNNIILNERSANIWKALSLTYTILCCVSPELPYMDIFSQSTSLNFNSEINYDYNFKFLESMKNPKETLSPKNLPIEPPLIAKKLLETFFELTAHCYNVKKLFKPIGKGDVISNDLLRVPPFRFQLILQELKYIHANFIKENNVNKELETCSLSNKFKSFIHAISIYLFYPSVLVHPIPVEFNHFEATWLFEASNNITEFYINWIENTLPSNKINERKVAEVKDRMEGNKIVNKLETILQAPIFMQVTPPIFVYLSFLKFTPKVDNDQLYLHSKERVLKTITMISRFCETFYNKFDAPHALSRIRTFLPGFLLEESIHNEILAALNG